MSRPAADSVRVVWTGTGQGTMSLGAAVTGFQAFPSSLDGQIVAYSIEHQGDTSPTVSERENGIGTYTDSGTTLSRDLVTFSTAGAPSKVDFSDGTKHVRLTALAHDFIENRATSDPTVNDDIDSGYISGRARWINTSTSKIFYCTAHASGAAVWAEITSAPISGTSVTSSRAIANSDHGKRLRWQGTSAGRLDVPSGLTTGLKTEVVIDHDLANVAELTIERTVGPANVVLGDMGGILQPGRIAQIRVVEDGIYIDCINGTFDQATLKAQNGGASFLLEAGNITDTGGIAASWTDSYGLHDFELNTGTPGVTALGSLKMNASSADQLLAATVTYAGDSTLIGGAFRVDSVVPSDQILLHWFDDFGVGRGWYTAILPGNLFAIQFMIGASAHFNFLPTYVIGKPLAFAAAIHHPTTASAGYVYFFFDDGTGGKTWMTQATGQTFGVDWTGGSVNTTIGPLAVGAGESITGEIAAVTMRDNVTFSNVTDAIDQARALLREMGSYG